MKKIAVLTVACLLVLTTAQAQTQSAKKDPKIKKVSLKKHESTMVGDIDKSQFYSDFGKIANVQWQRTPYFDEATFTKDGKTMTAYYDYDEDLVGTTSVAKFSDLPASGQKEIQKIYKGYKIGPVIFFDDNEANDTDMLLYGTQFEDEDSYFVELTNTNNKIVVHVTSDGNVYYFKQLTNVS